MSVVDQSDSELIELSLRSPAIFATIFDRHAAKIGAYAARRVGPDTAEDIMSETFLVAFRKRESFDLEVASALPWLYGIAARLLRKHRATQARYWRSVMAQTNRAERAPDIASDADARVDARADLKLMLEQITKLSQGDNVRARQPPR